MPHTASSNPATGSKITPASKATNADLACFFNVGDDTRCDILRGLGLPKRRSYFWTELLNAFGLMPEQPEELWDELTLGAARKNVLWDAARVASEIDVAPATVNGWCRKGYPEGFPLPLINLGPKRRWWLPLEVRAYNQPSLYGDLARAIRRKPAPAAAQRQAVPIACHGTLQPLPPR